MKSLIIIYIISKELINNQEGEMLLEINLLQKTKCSKRKKLKALEVIHQMGMLTEKTRTKGLLALEDDLDEIRNNFIVEGLSIVLIGTDPDILDDKLPK